MVKRKTKAIQTDLGTFRHNQAHSKPCVNRAYPEPWYIQNLNIFKIRNIFRTLVYSELWYIENSGIFKTQGLFRHLRCQTSAMKGFVKTVNGKKVSQYKLAPFSTSWNKYHEVLKKIMADEGARDREILIYLLIYSNKLAYLQPITILV